MTPDTLLEKKSLRAQFQAAREGVRPDEAKAAGLALARHLVGFIPPTATTVAGYRAVRGEIDLSEAMARLSERGHTLCLPVVEAPRLPLSFRQWCIGHPLTLGHYGIEVPATSEPLRVPDVVIVPLLAFDSEGYRLGYGAGYYDFTLRQLRGQGKQVLVIGAAFTLQRAEALPHQPHDERLDAIITEQGVVRFV